MDSPRQTTLSAILWASILGSVVMVTKDVHPDAAVCPVSPSTCLCDTHLQGSKFKVKRIVCTDSGMGHTPFPKFNKSVKGASGHNEVVEKVSFIYAGLKDVPNGAFGKLNIFSLDLQGNNLGHRIGAKAFYGVNRALRSLNLAWSNVTWLNGKVFRGMIALQNLSLAENQIRELSGSIFHHLRSIRRLSLAGNPISHLPGPIFRYQTTLEMLDLGYCRLNRLPWTLFFGLWNLKLLDLRGNRLTSLEPYTFMDMTLLHTLLLGHNPLKRIHADVFHGLHNLAVLRLEESQIEHISRESFRELHNLRTLDLGDNAIHVIPPHTLTLPNLESLSLDGNHLSAFPMDIRFMPRLRSLDVSYNKITTIDRCLYDFLRDLDFFNLQENRLVCNCDLLWLKTLRIEMFRIWRSKTTYGRRHLTGPLSPGRCASPDKLRGVGSTSWLDLDCLKRARARRGTDQDLCREESNHRDKIDTRTRSSRHTNTSPEEMLSYLYHPFG